jgi:hypothetical protein
MPSPPIVFVIEIYYNFCSRIYIIVYDKLTVNYYCTYIVSERFKFLKWKYFTVLFISRWAMLNKCWNLIVLNLPISGLAIFMVVYARDS